MPNSDQIHECILRHLNAPQFATVRLVARLQDSAINNTSTHGYVFIPDLHLISDRWLPHYSYHFNEWDNFYRMLFRLRDARAELKTKQSDLEVIQLGDLFDLWRSGHALNADQIISDNVNLVKMLYTHPQGLMAKVLVGNHDDDMTGEPGWSLREIIRNPNNDIWGLALHGAWFDAKLNSIPEWLQWMALLLGGKLPKADVKKIGDPITADESEQSGGFGSYIQLKEPNSIGSVLSDPAHFPPEHNVARTSHGQSVHRFLPKAVALFEKMSTDSKQWATARVCILAHTHRPSISVDDSVAGRPVVMFDCGAWIEKCVDNNGLVAPNCQIGVVAGNDVRIYQLNP